VRRLLVSLTLVCVLATIAVAADAYRFYAGALVSGAAVRVEIEPGTGFQAIAALLQDAGVIDNRRHRLYFALLAHVKGAARRIQTGEYDIPAGQTPAQILALLTSGDTVRYHITLIDGWTFDQMRAAIDRHEALDHELQDSDAAAIMAALEHADEHAEGRFMPDTYFFSRGATDLSIYRRAYDAMQDYLDEAWAQRAQADIAVDTPYEALILASIIQKETAAADERRRIAGVFTRRLQRGMLLQTDPTVIYGKDDPATRITRRDLRTDTPYNTYIHAGLPPTPIAMPGRAAIDAALHPQDGDALYFVSRGDGTHKFSATLAEHNRAVAKYQLQ